jgi:hypothetical protein
MSILCGGGGSALAREAVGMDRFEPELRVAEHQTAEVGPTVLRLLVGFELRRCREAAGVTREAAGFAIRGSASKMSRLEAGRHSFKIRDISDLLTLYGVNAEADRQSLVALAEAANQPGWWHPYADLIPVWFEPYLGFEQDASVVRGYEVQVVPGLLQTREYARNVIALGHDDEVDRRVELRMERQRLLHRPHPPSVWVVIDEAVLWRPYGGPAVMRRQLRHLLEISQLPHVSVQIMPFSTGGHAAAGGPIALLRLPQPQLPDIVYLEQLTTGHYPDRPADLDQYWHVMNQLAAQAVPATQTPMILHGILRRM